MSAAVTGGPPRGPVTLLPSGPTAAALAAPTSKSVTNRLLVMATLAEGESELVDPLESDDSVAMRAAVRALGAGVEEEPGRWRITGTGGRLRVPVEPIDARLSGTTMRFVAALAALAPGPVTVTGLPPLVRRPVGELVGCLRALGAGATDRSGFPPVRVGGPPLRGGGVTVDISGSTQFATALLLVAPYAADDVALRTRGTGSRAYLALTAALMRAWGARVDEPALDRFTVAAGQGYEPRAQAVEYDASAAAHLYGVAAATGGSLTVTNAAATRQPDAAVVELLAAMGATVTREGDRQTVRGPERLEPLRADLSATPDQVTTFAALAALADGVSVLSGVGVARGHETDRLAALARELGRLGVGVTERPDGLEIRGGAARGPARLRTYDDHRLAMAFAAVGARIPGVTVLDPSCVAKTYPRFWDDLRAVGVAWREEAA